MQYFATITHSYCRFIPPGQGNIEMMENVGYQARPRGVINLTSSKLPSEADHIYEELPEEGKKETVHCISDVIHQQDVQKDADYYVNDDLFPEEYKTEQAAAAGQTKKNDDDYYVNDDLFPKHDEEEQHTSATSVHVKNSNGDGDGDYYVNDDLFPNSTTAQAAHSSHSDEGLASADIDN